MTQHAHTPRLDVVEPRGLEARTVAWCRGEANEPPQQRVSIGRWNVAGRPVAEWDPRLWANDLPANVTRIHSLSGLVILEDSVDAGWHVRLGAADGQVIEITDGRGNHSRTDFDGLLRPLSITETALGGQPVVVERYGYGDASDASAQRNQCGRLIRHDDPAGTWRCDAFGLAGGVLSANRRFLQDSLLPDWPVDLPQRDQLLESGEGHTTTMAFDAAASIVRQTDSARRRDRRR